MIKFELDNKAPVTTIAIVVKRTRSRSRSRRRSRSRSRRSRSRRKRSRSRSRHRSRRSRSRSRHRHRSRYRLGLFINTLANLRHTYSDIGNTMIVIVPLLFDIADISANFPRAKFCEVVGCIFTFIISLFRYYYIKTKFSVSILSMRK